MDPMEKERRGKQKVTLCELYFWHFFPHFSTVFSPFFVFLSQGTRPAGWVCVRRGLPKTGKPKSNSNSSVGRWCASDVIVGEDDEASGVGESGF